MHLHNFTTKTTFTRYSNLIPGIYNNLDENNNSVWKIHWLVPTDKFPLEKSHLFSIQYFFKQKCFCKQSYWFWYLHECTTSLQRLEMPIRPLYFPLPLEARYQKFLRIKA